MQWFVDMIVAICKAYTDSEILAAKVIPSGTIILWTSTYATIPTGWTACDGTNGTPDLRSLFARGAGSGVATGDTGGSTTHTLPIGDGVPPGGAYSITQSTLPPWHGLWYIMKL